MDTKKKKLFKRVCFGGMISTIFGLIILIGFLLNPSLSYAHHTDGDQVRIYHNRPLEKDTRDAIANALHQVEKSELYDENVVFHICLESQSRFASMVRSLMGDDVVKAFANQSVVLAEEKNGFFHWRAKNFRTDQMLAHAFVHNLQFRHHGLFDANPLGGHAEWKWEGYADYIAFGKYYGWCRLLEAYQQSPDDDLAFVPLNQGEGSIRLHIRYLIMVAYCLEEKGMNYQSLIDHTMDSETIWHELTTP